MYMKRVMVSVDLSENEVLEKEVQEAVRATARQFSREEFDKCLREEMRRIAKREVENLEYHRYSKNSRIDTMARDEVVAAVNKAIGDITIPQTAVKERIELVMDRIEEKIDFIVAEQLKAVSVEDYILGKVRQEVKSKVPDALLDMIVNGVQNRSQSPEPFTGKLTFSKEKEMIK